MKARTAFVLTALLQFLHGAGLCQAQTSNIIGNWKVEVTFASGEKRSLRFEAEASGKGSLLLMIPEPLRGGSAEASSARWSRDDQSVTFSGPVEFPLGNVGREAGTLVLKGKLGTEGSMTGEAKLFGLDQNPEDPKARPSKSGTFKATRIAD